MQWVSLNYTANPHIFVEFEFYNPHIKPSINNSENHVNNFHLVFGYSMYTEHILYKRGSFKFS